MEKLCLLLRPAHLETVLSSPDLLAHPALTTLLLACCPTLLVQAEADSWVSPTARLLAASLAAPNTGPGPQGEQTPANLTVWAGEHDCIAWPAVITALQALLAARPAPALLHTVLAALPALLEGGLAAELGSITALLTSSLGPAALQFWLAAAAGAADIKLGCLCLSSAASAATADLVAAGAALREGDGLVHLVVCLLSPAVRLQRSAFALLEKLQSADVGKCRPLLHFFAENKAELVSNLDNLSSVLAAQSLETKACRELLTRCLANSKEYFTKLAPIFKGLTNKKDAETIFKFGQHLLVADDGDIEVRDETVSLLTTQFSDLLLDNLASETVLGFLTDCLASKLVVTRAGLRLRASEVLLESLVAAAGADLAGRVEREQQTSLLSALVQLSRSSAAPQSHRLLLAISLDPDLLTQQLTRIWGADAFSVGTRKTRNSLLVGAGEGDRTAWAATCWLLEGVERYLGAGRAGQLDWLPLLRPLFSLLRRAAGLEGETGSYPTSLTLELLLRILSAAPDSRLAALQPVELQPELLVHCVRSCPGPDTRHTALRVLARCAIASPDFILQNSVTIFTFMGSNLLKVDSRHSFQVACQALEVIVPAIQAACRAPGRAAQLQSTCLGVLNTFIDASGDIPAHRLSEFLARLVARLGSRDYLWLAALLLVKKERAGGERRAVELVSEAGVEPGLQALLRLLVNTRSDQLAVRRLLGVKQPRREAGQGQGLGQDGGEEKADDWDVLRLRGLQLTSRVLTTPAFRKMVSTDCGEEGTAELLRLLIEAAILSVEEFSALSSSVPAKLRKNLASGSERVLEHSLALLPPVLFLELTGGLLTSPAVSVRHRALEAASAKLAPPSPLPPASLPVLIAPLVQLAVKEQQPHTQQLAFLTLRQLAKLLSEPGPLVEPSLALDTALLATLSNPKVLGAAVLSCGDLLVCTAPHSVGRVPGLVSWLCHKLEDSQLGAAEGWAERELAVVQNSALYSLQRLLEAFSGFLSPLLARMVGLACRLSGCQLTAARANPLLSALAAGTPAHTTLSLAGQLLDSSLTGPAASLTLPPLLNFVADNCRRLERAQLAAVSRQFCELFTRALGYRARAGPAAQDEVEQSIINAFLSIALKLSLEDFMPVYTSLANLLLVQADPAHLTTMFNLTGAVAAKLKSLFSFGLESFLPAVSTVLEVERPAGLVAALLASLTTFLTYNKLESVSVTGYERLVASLLQPALLPAPALPATLTQLTIATPDDTNWKHLHFQVLSQHFSSAVVWLCDGIFIMANPACLVAAVPTRLPAGGAALRSLCADRVRDGQNRQLPARPAGRRPLPAGDPGG